LVVLLLLTFYLVELFFENLVAGFNLTFLKQGLLPIAFKPKLLSPRFFFKCLDCCMSVVTHVLLSFSKSALETYVVTVLNCKYLAKKLKLCLYQVHALVRKVKAVLLIKLTKLLDGEVDLREKRIIVAGLHQSLLEFFYFLEKLLQHLLAVVAASL